jgi:hypothetical protein
MKNIITIQEETMIEQDDKKIILEKGDRIEVLKEDETTTWKEFIDKKLLKHNGFSEFVFEIPNQQVSIRSDSYTSCKLEGNSLKILFKSQVDEFMITPDPNDIVTLYEKFNVGFLIHLKRFGGIFYTYY